MKTCYRRDDIVEILKNRLFLYLKILSLWFSFMVILLVVSYFSQELLETTFWGLILIFPVISFFWILTALPKTLPYFFSTTAKKKYNSLALTSIIVLENLNGFTIEEIATRHGFSKERIKRVLDKKLPEADRVLDKQLFNLGTREQNLLTSYIYQGLLEKDLLRKDSRYQPKRKKLSQEWAKVRIKLASEVENSS